MNRYLGALILLAACGGKSTPPPVTSNDPPPATCKDIGDRAGADVAKELPDVAPEDFGPRFGAMITRLCTDDQWPQAVIDCGMTSDDPRKECSPMLDDTQRAHLDEEQTQLTEELVAAMGVSGSVDLSAPTGMANCDELRRQAVLIGQCEPAVAEMGEDAYNQMVMGLATLGLVPDDQKTNVDGQCEKGVPELAAVVTKFCP